MTLTAYLNIISTAYTVIKYDIKINTFTRGKIRSLEKGRNLKTTTVAKMNE